MPHAFPATTPTRLASCGSTTVRCAFSFTGSSCARAPVIDLSLSFVQPSRMRRLLCCSTRAKTVCSPAGGRTWAEESAVYEFWVNPLGVSPFLLVLCGVHRRLPLRRISGGSAFSLTQLRGDRGSVHCTASVEPFSRLFFALFVDESRVVKSRSAQAEEPRFDCASAKGLPVRLARPRRGEPDPRTVDLGGDQCL